MELLDLLMQRLLLLLMLCLLLLVMLLSPLLLSLTLRLAGLRFDGRNAALVLTPKVLLVMMPRMKLTLLVLLPRRALPLHLLLPLLLVRLLLPGSALHSLWTRLSTALTSGPLDCLSGIASRYCRATTTFQIQHRMPPGRLH